MTRIIKQLKAGARAAAGWSPDALMVGGAAAISYGARLVYEPAGFVISGLFLLAAGWLTARGAK